MVGTLLGTSITGTLVSEPQLDDHAQVVVARFTIEEHHAAETQDYEVYAYGSIARECVRNIHSGETVTVEGRLVKHEHESDEEHESNEEHARVLDGIVANRVWLNHLRLLVA